MTNDTTTELAEPELRLRAQQRTPISRSMLERWLQPDSLSATHLLHASTLDDPIPPGGAEPFTIRVPADELPLDTTYFSWGPRGLEVALADLTDPVTPAATTRSYLLWWPDLTVETMPLAVLGAVTPTAAERVAAHRSGSSVATTAAARLTPLLAALDQPAVDVALDPSLLVDPPAGPAPASSEEPTAAGGDGEEAGAQDDDATTADRPSSGARREATQLREAITSLATTPTRSVHVLPWADADVAALTHADRTDLLAEGAELTAEALEAGGLTDAVGDGISWPAAAQPDSATLETAVDSGARAVVLPSSAIEVVDQLTYTPSGRAELTSNAGELPGLAADDRLSALLAGEHLPYLEDDAPAISLDPLTARQLLLAETAVIARERPSDRRDLVLALPRSFDGDPSELGERLSVLAHAPWLDRVDLAEVLSHEAPTGLERTELPDRVVEAGEISTTEIDRAAEVLERTSAFAGILEDPAALVEPVRHRLLDVLSAAWREVPGSRGDILDDSEAEVAARRGLVAAQPGSTLNLINTEAHLPVTVSNSLDEPAHVQVHLRPRDPRLVAPDAVPLVVPAHQTSTAQVPVHAVGSGDVTVEVLLTSPDGAPIDEATDIRVRVRADWETVGTAVVAGLLVVMLVAGIIRTVRRARHAGPAHARAPEEDA